MTDSLAVLKKETDDAKKKLAADNKGLVAKEAELKKSDTAIALIKKEVVKLDGELVRAESKLTKARDSLKKEEAVGSPEQGKLDALKKSLTDAEKSVASIKEKFQAFTRDTILDRKESALSTPSASRRVRMPLSTIR